MKRQRTHNEYFRSVQAGGRKSCPSCKAKLSFGELIWSWGEYVVGKWRTVTHFCHGCWPEHQAKLTAHRAECGCNFVLVGYQGEQLPTWLTLDDPVPTGNEQERKQVA